MMEQFEHGGGIYGKNIRLDFSVNTNPLGLHEKIKNAAAGAADRYGLYPDENYTELKKAIAEYENISAENIAVSNGASEMIFAVVRAVMPKRAILVSPTFCEYERALLSVGCELEFYDTKEENKFAIGTDILDRLDSVDMAFICNPNNPTGTLCDKKILEAIAEKNITCVVDECFMDFTDGCSMKGRLPVIRAFTKTYAMAGLRLGYLIADRELIKRVQAQLPAWNVSAPAQAAGAKAIDCGDYLKKSKELIKTEREYLTAGLKKHGFKVFKSDANFLLVKGREGIGQILLKKGILIRECDNFRSLNGRYYRIAVKTHAENKILIKELGDILWQNL